MLCNYNVLTDLFGPELESLSVFPCEPLGEENMFIADLQALGSSSGSVPSLNLNAMFPPILISGPFKFTASMVLESLLSRIGNHIRKKLCNIRR